jgi:hypothetical protein
MDFSVYKEKLPVSGHEVMQRFGYGHITSHHTGKDSYVKRLYREHYPRFHCYISEGDGKVTFSLHLDQKEASYKGNHMHSGEYDGPLVESEIDNLKRHIVALIQRQQVLDSQAKRTVQAKSESEDRPWWKVF